MQSTLNREVPGSNPLAKAVVPPGKAGQPHLPSLSEKTENLGALVACSQAAFLYGAVLLSRVAVPLEPRKDFFANMSGMSIPHGSYVIYVAVTGSTWRSMERCHVHPVTGSQARTSRNCHVEPVTATR